MRGKEIPFRKGSPHWTMVFFWMLRGHTSCCAFSKAGMRISQYAYVAWYGMSPLTDCWFIWAHCTELTLLNFALAVRFTRIKSKSVLAGSSSAAEILCERLYSRQDIALVKSVPWDLIAVSLNVFWITKTAGVDFINFYAERRKKERPSSIQDKRCATVLDPWHSVLGDRADIDD